VIRTLGWLLGLVQAVLGARVVWRLWRTGHGTPIRAVQESAIQSGSVAIMVPVLDEAHRIASCLDGLLAQGPEAADMLIVDGGSTDETRDLVRVYARRDRRLRLVEAGPAPTDWNGKVWGLSNGERALQPGTEWVLTLDADVHAAPALARSLLATAKERHLRMLSVATTQRLSGAVEGLLHPALLSTLVYRFGRPGGSTRSPSGAMANGQCCLVRRDLLHQLGGFSVVRDSLCEDVTLARLAARSGNDVGFFEADGLVEVAMYADWREAWRNWPRSLATRDALSGVAGWLGLLEVLLLQALPLPVLLTRWPVGAPRRLNLLLLAVRAGMLVGMARAYPSRPPTYWFSPLLDMPAALALWRSALCRRQTWRGRTYQRHKGLIVAV
jgi:dolichol-phosphate mannosyltransferase